MSIPTVIKAAAGKWCLSITDNHHLVDHKRNFVQPPDGSLERHSRFFGQGCRGGTDCEQSAAGGGGVPGVHICWRDYHQMSQGLNPPSEA